MMLVQTRVDKLLRVEQLGDFEGAGSVVEFGHLNSFENSKVVHYLIYRVTFE